jgi:hypothetical protein
MKNKIIIAVAFLLTVVITSFVTWNLCTKSIYNEEQAAYQNIDAQMTKLRGGDVDSFYNSLSDEYKKSISLADFKATYEPKTKDTNVINFSAYKGDGTYLVIYDLTNDSGTVQSSIVVDSIKTNDGNTIESVSLIK